jgi:cytochrome c-type biogenesis protein CcmF
MEVTNPNPSQSTVKAILRVEKDGKFIWTGKPQKDFYKSASQQPSTDVDILSTLKEDLYLILAGFTDDGSATFKVLINPLTKWLWIGGIVLGIGTLICMWPDMREKRRMMVSYSTDETLIKQGVVE